MAVTFTWPILGVVIPCILIGGLGYGIYFFTLLPVHQSKWQLIGFQFAITMTWISYYLAIKTPPGSPPPDYVPPPGTVRRWCFKCKGYKPERTHHCKTCKICVTKMDHHCPWTYNCVGYNNMPHFLRFIIWVDITAGYGLYRLILRCIEFYRIRNLPSYIVPGPQIFMTIILLPVTFFVSLTVGLLTIRVLMNITNGMSQIESWEDERISSAKRRGLIPRNTVFPYDLGVYMNFVNSLGPIYTWPLPWGRPADIDRAKVLGVAIRYERNESGYDEDGNPRTWPPDTRNVDPPPEYLERRNNSQSNSNVHMNDPEDSSDDDETPMTFSQTAMIQDRQIRNSISSEGSRGIEMSNLRPTRNGPRPSQEQNTVTPDEYPSWRQIRSDKDFYSREMWSTIEGEKLSDFGVDLDSEMDMSTVYAMNQGNLSNGREEFSMGLNNLYRNNNSSGLRQNSSHNGHRPAVGSTSSAALSRSSSPLLRHSSMGSNGGIHFNSLDDDISPIQSGGKEGHATNLPLSPSSAVFHESSKENEKLHSNLMSTSTGSNEDDLPLAKLLAMRRQEKIKLRAI